LVQICAWLVGFQGIKVQNPLQQRLFLGCN
jgi:hypothetical protein